MHVNERVFVLQFASWAWGHQDVAYVPLVNKALSWQCIKRKNIWFFTNKVCFYWLPVALLCHFWWRRHSSFPMRGIWEKVLGVAASLRGSIHHNVFFRCIATHAKGLGRSLRFTHAQTNSVISTAKGLGFKQAHRLLLSDWSKWVTWTQVMTFQC